MNVGSNDDLVVCCCVQRGGAVVFRRLCSVLGPEPVLVESAAVLEHEEDLAFACTMVQVRTHKLRHTSWENTHKYNEWESFLGTVIREQFA